MIAVELISLTDPAEAVVVSASKVAPEIAAIAFLFMRYLPSHIQLGYRIDQLFRSSKIARFNFNSASVFRDKLRL